MFIKILKQNTASKKALKKRRDRLRNSLTRALREETITRTEYNLIWDLTTELNMFLAEYYFERAILGV